jgi:S-adenosylmethionine/arginine decarboxylase-like enzyme
MGKAGRHLIIDGVVRDSKVFSHESLTKLFHKLVEALDMEIIAGPMFKDVELDPSKLTGDEFQDEGGTTGYCLISTSHIAIHTWELRNFFMMDAFSCKDFNEEKALRIICDHLGVDHSKLRINSLMREQF